MNDLHIIITDDFCNGKVAHTLLQHINLTTVPVAAWNIRDATDRPGC